MKRMQLISPAIWLFYAAIVFEFLFMIAPFALYFYSAYGPVLGVLAHSPWTAWLLGFFMPHFSHTTSPVLESLRSAGWMLAYAGLGLFLVSAFQLYGSKLLRRDAVTGWLYRYVRHPQYLALAVLGLGTTLIWPRFLVLVTYIAMLSLYRMLARHEEQACVRQYGESYRRYQARTGMFLPRLRAGGMDSSVRQRPRSGWTSVGVFAAALTAGLTIGFALREHTLASVYAVYLDRTAVLSPAPLGTPELLEVFRVAGGHPTTNRLGEASRTWPLIAYVVPADWYLPDLPIDPPEVVRQRGGHGTPADFDHRSFRVLFARVKTFAPCATGKDILRSAFGIEPLLIVDVDMTQRRPTGSETPPAAVVWGDIAAPLL